MNANEYQKQTAETALYVDSVIRTVEDSSETRLKNLLDLCYTGLGLAGEAGEFANKLKKVIRDKHGELDDESKRALAKELGGVAWYLSECASNLGYDLSQIMAENLNQLQSRKDRGALQGSGDDR